MFVVTAHYGVVFLYSLLGPADAAGKEMIDVIEPQRTDTLDLLPMEDGELIEEILMEMQPCDYCQDQTAGSDAWASGG